MRKALKATRPAAAQIGRTSAETSASGNRGSVSVPVCWAGRALIGVLFAVAVAAFTAACADQEESQSQTETQPQSQSQAQDQQSEPVLQVVASTQIVADWVRQVGGDVVTVRALVPAGADVHTLELTTDDVRAIAAADLVVINGAGLESAYQDIILENAARLLDLADELSELRPDEAGALNQRAQGYIVEIREANEIVTELLADLPKQRRFLVTFHDAFGYFARRYNLTVAGFVVEGPEQSVSAETIAELVELIEHEGIDRIYREPQFESGSVDAVADETGAEVGIIFSQPSRAVDTDIDILLATARAIAVG